MLPKSWQKLSKRAPEVHQEAQMHRDILVLVATIEKFVKEYGDGVVIDYDLNKINDHKSHSFYNVTSLEAFAKILDNPFAREWDKANNCKDIVYKLEGPL